MKGKNHAIAGLCAGGCTVASIITAYGIPGSGKTIAITAGTFAVAYLGSLFPDIDSRTSKMGKKLKITSKIVSSLFGHRGFFHSPLFAGLIYLLCRFLFERNGITEFSPIYIGFIAGMLMHLACDMATKGGLPLLYPYTRKRFSISILESGSKYEVIPLIFICMLAVGLTVFMLYKQIYITNLF